MATITWLDKIDGLDLLNPQKNVNAADMNQIKTAVNTNDGSFTSHTSNISNPHSVTKTQVGLGNVDNTSDVNKPVSTAQQTALDLKANLNSPDLTGAPTATTASANNNSTRIATTAYADGAVAASLATLYVEGEVPSGSLNSSNVTFVLANSPVAGSVKVYWNGMKMRVGVGYTISGATITMTTPPENGDTLEADYRK